jgi:DMSO reductase anchor subunit
MRPALSVLFLTTLLGVAQGLFVALYAIELGAALGLTGKPARSLPVAGAALSLALLGLGLLASFFHLGRPERAWRAMTMWRTSWLSREVIVLPAFMAAVFAWGAGIWLDAPWTPWVGALALALCVALFVCTGMIYACLRFLQEWATPLTVINFFLLGLASGLSCAALLAALLAPERMAPLACWAIGFTVAGFAVRLAMLARNARLKPKSTTQSAIGVRHPRLVQKSQGLMGGSFNTREFFHGRSRAFLRSIRWFFLVAAFAVPVPLLAIAASSAAGGAALPVLVLAVLVQYAGLLAERWFFFAQANHPQNLYYQAVS